MQVLSARAIQAASNTFGILNLSPWRQCGARVQSYHTNQDKEPTERRICEVDMGKQRVRGMVRFGANMERSRKQRGLTFGRLWRVGFWGSRQGVQPSFAVDHRGRARHAQQANTANAPTHRGKVQGKRTSWKSVGLTSFQEPTKRGCNHERDRPPRRRTKKIHSAPCKPRVRKS